MFTCIAHLVVCFWYLWIIPASAQSYWSRDIGLTSAASRKTAPLNLPRLRYIQIFTSIIPEVTFDLEIIMETSHEIQQAIETRSSNDETEEKLRTRDIHQAISPTISDEAERTTRISRQDLDSENLDPTGKHYPFRILQPNRQVERVVVDWFMVSLMRPIVVQPLSIDRIDQISREWQGSSNALFLLTRGHIYCNGFWSQPPKCRDQGPWVKGCLRMTERK